MKRPHVPSGCHLGVLQLFSREFDGLSWQAGSRPGGRLPFFAGAKKGSKESTRIRFERRARSLRSIGWQGCGHLTSRKNLCAHLIGARPSVWRIDRRAQIRRGRDSSYPCPCVKRVQATRSYSGVSLPTFFAPAKVLQRGNAHFAQRSYAFTKAGRPPGRDPACHASQQSSRMKRQQLGLRT
jgi:hypothetical protein